MTIYLTDATNYNFFEEKRPTLKDCCELVISLSNNRKMCTELINHDNIYATLLEDINLATDNTNYYINKYYGNIKNPAKVKIIHTI